MRERILLGCHDDFKALRFSPVEVVEMKARKLKTAKDEGLASLIIALSNIA